MHNEGFRVRLSSVASFQQTVADTVDDYQKLVKQLRSADLNADEERFERLLGHVNYPGSARVDDACRTMLTSYATLYRQLLRAHEVIKDNLEYTATALTETHDLYSEIDGRHEIVFRGLLDGMSRPGGEHGTAGQK